MKGEPIYGVRIKANLLQIFACFQAELSLSKKIHPRLPDIPLPLLYDRVVCLFDCANYLSNRVEATRHSHLR